MPEGPEVRLNHDLLIKELKGKKLTDLNIVSGKLQKNKPKGFLAFKKTLPSQVKTVGIRGKFIWLEMADGWTIGIGFGMTGRISQNPEANHIRIDMEINNKDHLYYVDMRNFGTWYFWKPDEDGLQKKLKELGSDLITGNLTKKEVVELFRKADKQEITKALMSQKVLAGVGNYLKAEGLYASKIYPYATVAELSDENLYDLYKKLVKIAKHAHTVQSKWNERPYEDFQEMMKVYSKKKDPDGHTVKRSSDTKDRRTTWWVPEVQTIGK